MFIDLDLLNKGSEYKNLKTFLIFKIILDTKGALNDTVIEVRRDKRWRDKIMTLEEYAQQKAKQAAKVAREEGREEGISFLNTLNDLLLKDNRLDDLKRAINDEEFRERLFKEYNINA